MIAERHPAEVPNVQLLDINVPQEKSVITITVEHRPNSRQGPSEVPLSRPGDESAPGEESRAPIDPNEEQSYGKIGDNVSQVSSMNERHLSSKNETLPKSAAHEATEERPEARQQANAVSSRHETVSSETNEHFSNDEEIQMPQSATSETVKEGEPAVEELETDMGTRSGAASVATKALPLSFKDDLNPRFETKEVASGASSVTFQLDTDSTKRRGTKSSINTAREDEGTFQKCSKAWLQKAILTMFRCYWWIIEWQSTEYLC